MDKPKVPSVSKEILDKLKCDILPSCFRSNGDKFCDFTVVVGGIDFPCHRFVLNACSGFFEALFRSNMKECQEMRVTLHEISSEIFRLIINVIYGSCECLVPDKMIDIWKAAHELQIKFLLSACESHFMKIINADNYFLIYNHAELLQSSKVKNVAFDYMARNFNALVLSDNFKDIDNECFLQLIRNKNLPMCEDLKVEVILKWCGADNKNGNCKSPKSGKLQFLGDLVQAVNLANVTAKCLANLLTNPFIQEDEISCPAVNSQAAKNMVKPTFEDDHRFKLDPFLFPVCPHCNRRRNLELLDEWHHWHWHHD